MTLSVPLLLDTCAAIWLSSGTDLSESATESLEQAYDAGDSVYVSPITAWEIGMLARRGRLGLLVTPHVWFQRLFDVLRFQLAAMPPEILIDSAFLPGMPPRDPADRVLAATARAFGYRLVTRDRPLLVYGEQGHIQTLSC